MFGAGEAAVRLAEGLAGESDERQGSCKASGRRDTGGQAVRVCVCARASVFLYTRGPCARDRGAPRPQPGCRAPSRGAAQRTLCGSRSASISGVGGLQHGRRQRCRCSMRHNRRSGPETSYARPQGGFGRAAGALSWPREPNGSLWQGRQRVCAQALFVPMWQPAQFSPGDSIFSWRMPAVVACDLSNFLTRSVSPCPCDLLARQNPKGACGDQLGSALQLLRRAQGRQPLRMGVHHHGSRQLAVSLPKHRVYTRVFWLITTVKGLGFERRHV